MSVAAGVASLIYPVKLWINAMVTVVKGVACSRLAMIDCAGFIKI